MVRRKGMISAGTARRNAGSAINSRRYAGLAIDCANPLMESERIDALAASARAIASPLGMSLAPYARKDVPHPSESLSLESGNRNLSTRLNELLRQPRRMSR